MYTSGVRSQITTMIMSKVPFRFDEAGSGPTKSTPIVSQGRVGISSVFSSPYSGWFVGFNVLQTGQLLQKASTSEFSPFHQTLSRKYVMVFRGPRWARIECACKIRTSRSLHAPIITSGMHKTCLSLSFRNTNSLLTSKFLNVVGSFTILAKKGSSE